MSLVRIHCYGCANTVPVEESAMSRGLQQAAWSLSHGETYCPSCAAARGLSALVAEQDESAADPATPPIDSTAALEPFVPQASILGESRSRRAWRLLRASATVLREDPELVVFPAVAMALSLLLGAFAFALSLPGTGTEHAGRTTILIASLLSAYPITFVSLYCGVALASVLAGRLEGHPQTASDGWRAARERVGIIAAWTLLSCTVGAVLRLIEQYVPIGARIVVALVDLSWSLATMFAVPVLAYEKLGPLETFRRSAQIFKQRWGTQIGGTVGIGVASAFFYIPFVVLVMIGVATPGSTGVLLIILGGAGLFAAIAVQAALDQVFRVFVYRNAIGLDTTHGPFSSSDLQAPFANRRRRSFF